MHDSGTPRDGDTLPTSVDHVVVLVSVGRQFPVAQKPILGSEHDAKIRIDEVRGEGRNSEAKIDDPVALKVLGNDRGKLFST